MKYFRGLRYDPERGLFYKETLKVHESTGRHERLVGSVDRSKNGYVMVSIPGGKTVRGHRLAVYLMTGDWPKEGQVVDHVNGNPADNRWENLRIVTQEINSQNRTKTMLDTQSRLLGVEARVRVGGRIVYRSKIFVDGKSHDLGTFSTAEEAHAAYIEAKRLMHPGCTI